MTEKKSDKPKQNYWRVFWIGLAYILLLGLFTYFFNLPI